MGNQALRPSAGQLEWQAQQIGMFFHFGLNTYFDLEWSDGTLPPEAFNPVDLDVDQWMDVAVTAGARYVVLTAKHHDGFCLWPTATTDYSVASSPWRDGRGDLVKEFVAAARRRGLKVGLYLSPWDRHAPEYADPAEYARYYCRQLTELCTRYGEIFELWFDGAGSEGYCYDWQAINAVIAEHQPQAMVFNMGAPTIRWVGNEDGLASDPVEYVVNRTQMSNYTVHTTELVEALYLPPECDVSLRHGWFHTENDEPKSTEHLLAIYYRSVGLGANLLLNVPPDRRGLVCEADRRRIEEFGAEVRRRFGHERGLPLRQLGEGEWEVDLDGEPFDHLVLSEELSNGQRVDSHQVVVDGEVVAAGGTIGAQRIHWLGTRAPNRLVVRLTGNAPVLRAARVHAADVDHLPTVTGGYLAPTESPLT